MIDLNSTLASLAPAAALLLIAAIVFAESAIFAGFFLPGDSLLFFAGVMVATGTLGVPFALVLGTVVLAAFVGDQVGYQIGRRTGPRLFRRPDSWLFSQRQAQRAHDFFERHGPGAVVLARFVPVVRSFVPAVAGVGAMRYRRFVVYNAIGALGWGVVMLTAGYLLGGVPFVAAHVELITVGIVLLSLIPALIGIVRNRRAARRPAPEDVARVDA